jgi:hypothetical protein
VVRTVRKSLLKADSQLSYAIDCVLSKLKHFKLEGTISIFGTYRSGSTWLMEILESLPQSHSVFEPLNPKWYPRVQKIVPYTPFIPEGGSLEALHRYLLDVFSGNACMKSPHLTAIPNFLTAKTLIVKFVRANTMLPWIAKTFPLRGVYFIIRHPCATIASQLATGYYSKITLKQLLEEIKKVPELADNKELIARLSGINSEIERLAAVWAFENYVPLASEKPHPWYTVVYERLVASPHEELRSIFQHIREDVPKDALKRVRIPSRVARETYGRDYIGTPKQLVKWREKLSERQVRDILKVVSWFGLDFYDEKPEPDYGALLNWRSPFRT